MINEDDEHADDFYEDSSQEALPAWIFHVLLGGALAIFNQIFDRWWPPSH